MTTAYDHELGKNAANFAALSPIGFIERAASVHPNRLAVVHGAKRYTWAQTYARTRRLASALAAHGVGRGDTVAAMLPNTPEMYEAHFGVHIQSAAGSDRRCGRSGWVASSPAARPWGSLTSWSASATTST